MGTKGEYEVDVNVPLATAENCPQPYTTPRAYAEFEPRDSFESALLKLLRQHRSKAREYGSEAVYEAPKAAGVRPVQYQLARMMEKAYRACKLEQQDAEALAGATEWQTMDEMLIDIAGHALLAYKLNGEEE